MSDQPSQGLYLNTGQHKHRISTYTHQTPMPCLGFEPTIPASEQAKTVHAFGRSATMTGLDTICCPVNKESNHIPGEERVLLLMYYIYIFHLYLILSYMALPAKFLLVLERWPDRISAEERLSSLRLFMIFLSHSRQIPRYWLTLDHCCFLPRRFHFILLVPTIRCYSLC
jgi:hypothetical protein